MLTRRGLVVFGPGAGGNLEQLEQSRGCRGGSYVGGPLRRCLPHPGVWPQPARQASRALDAASKGLSDSRLQFLASRSAQFHLRLALRTRPAVRAGAAYVAVPEAPSAPSCLEVSLQKSEACRSWANEARRCFQKALFGGVPPSLRALTRSLAASCAAVRETRGAG